MGENTHPFGSLGPPSSRGVDGADDDVGHVLLADGVGVQRLGMGSGHQGSIQRWSGAAHASWPRDGV